MIAFRNICYRCRLIGNINKSYLYLLTIFFQREGCLSSNLWQKNRPTHEIFILDITASLKDIEMTLVERKVTLKLSRRWI